MRASASSIDSIAQRARALSRAGLGLLGVASALFERHVGMLRVDQVAQWPGLAPKFLGTRWQRWKSDPTKQAKATIAKLVLDPLAFTEQPKPIPLATVEALRPLGGLALLKERNAYHAARHLRRSDVRLVNYPTNIQLEVSTACNLRCLMCSTTRPKHSRPAFIDMALVQKLVPIMPYLSKAQLQGTGEPLLVPYIRDIIDKFRAYDVSLSTVTNGTVIDESLARMIGESFSSIAVSIDGATAGTYELIRKGGSFEKLLRGLELVNKYRRPGFRLTFAATLMRCNLDELPELVRLAHRCGANRIQGSWLIPFKDLPWTVDQEPSRDAERANERLVEAREVARELGIEVGFPPKLRVPRKRAAPPPTELAGRPAGCAPAACAAAPGACGPSAPGSSAPGSSAPGSSAPGSSAPGSSAPGSSAPANARAAAGIAEAAKPRAARPDDEPRISVPTAAPAPRRKKVDHKAVFGDLFDTDRVSGHCPKMYEHAMIKIDGVVRACCVATSKLGSLQDEEFAAIWNGARYLELRETFNSGHLPAACRTCSFLRSGRLPGAKLVYDPK